MSYKVAISGIAGDDLSFTVKLTYNGLPLDVTNYTVEATVTYGSTEQDYTLTVVDAPSGTVTWNIPHTDTVQIGTRYYRIYVTDTSGNVSTCLHGTLGIISV